MGCSHGIGQKDKCTCFTHGDGDETVPMWTGADCSMRTCPKAGSWAASPSANNDHVSAKVECAGRGKCNRGSGECACDVGYGGSACQRTICPNSCNGHGTCHTLNQLADDFSSNADSEAASALFATPDSSNDCAECTGTENTGAQYNSAWDATRSAGCKCDSGYRGPDCMQKECPSGDDVLEDMVVPKDVLAVDVVLVTTPQACVNVIPVSMATAASPLPCWLKQSDGLRGTTH